MGEVEKTIHKDSNFFWTTKEDEALRSNPKDDFEVRVFA